MPNPKINAALRSFKMPFKFRKLAYVVTVGCIVGLMHTQSYVQASELNAETVVETVHPEVSVSAPKLNELVPEAQRVGKGLFKYFLWRVYEAELLAANGEWQHPQGYEQPFALRLTYLRDLKGEAIAERTLDEMREQGFENEDLMAKWFAQIKLIFPDVSNGVSLVGVHMPGVGAHFFRDETYLGTVHDVQFSRLFFDIWLSEKTTGPELRRQLLNL